jgi:hypothetical protein
MDQFEANTHSFIVKIWREEVSSDTSQAAWRGHITHVPGGERRYLRSLDDLSTIIIPYIEEMGVKLSLWWRVKQWLNRRTLL